MSNKPSYKYGWLYRQGFRIEPCNVFVEKYKEFFNEYLKIQKPNREPIDDNDAKFFINIICEAIITCLDFGLNVRLRKLFDFRTKLSDYVLNSPNRSLINKKYVENVKKISIKIAPRFQRFLRQKLNKDNEEYINFLNQKKESFDNIKRYYREFYGKEDEWWQYLS